MSKKVAKPTKVKDAVFVYTSTCCGEPATKPPCVSDKELRRAGQPSESSLGHWNCSRCRKACKVTRSKNKVEQKGSDE